MTELDLLKELIRLSEAYGDSALKRAFKIYSSPTKRAKALGQVTKRKPIPTKWITEALDRQEGKCGRCGERIAGNVSGDHIEPLATGGAHASYNIAALHPSCNSAKGARSVFLDCKKMDQSLLDREKLLKR